MAMERPPAFQFYPKDFLSSDAVSLMTTEQIGAYTLLLCHAWLRPEGLPSDLPSLAKLARCQPKRFEATIWPGVSGCFKANDGGLLMNSRLERARADQDAYRLERSQSGRRGAATRWAEKRDGSANGSAMREPIAKNSSSPASASSTAKSFPKEQESSPPPTPLPGGRGRADWLWNHWRRLMLETRQMAIRLSPKVSDYPALLEVCDMVPDDNRLLMALERFMRLTPEQAKTMSVKVITPATFRMALSRLLEPQPIAGVTARTAGNIAALEAFVAKGQAS